MNIATSTATPVPTSGKNDTTASPTRGTQAVDGDGVDPSAVSVRTGGDVFGQMLAQRIDDGSTRDLSLPGTGSDGTGATSPDGPPPFATTANALLVTVEAGSAAGPSPRGSPTSAAATDVTARSTDDPAAMQDGDAAVNDIAAQLALVSQWIAGAPPPAIPAPTTTAETGVETRPGTVDTAAGRGTGPRTIASRSSTDGVDRGPRAPEGPPDAMPSGDPIALPPVAATIPTVTPAADRGVRPGPTVAAARSNAIAPRDGPERTSGSDGVPALDAMLARMDGTGGRALSDNAARADAFVTQVAAQMANAPPTTIPLASIASTASPISLHAAVGTPAWSGEVGQATLRMAVNDLQTASLRLNPEHLGPLDVQVRIDNGIAHVAFNAAHAETRQAIEASRTTLDQLFADQGLKIGDCTVGDSSGQRGFEATGSQADGSRRDSSDRRAAGRGADDGGVVVGPVIADTRAALGLVDTFA